MTFKMIAQHLYLVFTSCLFSVAIGIPLGIIAYYHRRLGRFILNMVDLIQTVPILAVMGLLMIWLGANSITVIVALTVYLLLPIVRNTHTGLAGVNPALKETADAMGMTRRQKLLRVEFPLAVPFIVTGIHIAVVTAIGVAVFGTFVGGGGLGSILYRGIRIQNISMILEGTLALIAMSVLFDTVLGYLEKKVFGRYTNEISQ